MSILSWASPTTPRRSTLLERLALDRRRRGKLAHDRRRAPSTSPRRSCCPPATGSRSTPTSTGSTAASRTSPTCLPHIAGGDRDERRAAPVRALRRGAPSRTCSRSPPGWTRWSSARARSSARYATALHPRPGRRHRRPGAQRRLPAGAARRQARPRRDRHRPGRAVGGAAPPSTGVEAGSACPCAARRALVVGAGSMAGLAVAHLDRRGAASRRRRQPHPDRAERLAGVGRRSLGRARRRWPTRSPRPTSSSRAPAPPAS